jgi:HAE1 family hydrophobic/amphiphilic exporter-1
MTSFAFIFGLFPLWNALGAGAQARRLIGTVTITGMIFSSAFAIFLIPVLFVIVERLSHRTQGTKLKITAPREQQEPAVAVAAVKRSPR